MMSIYVYVCVDVFIYHVVVRVLWEALESNSLSLYACAHKDTYLNIYIYIHMHLCEYV